MGDFNINEIVQKILFIEPSYVNMNLIEYNYSKILFPNYRDIFYYRNWFCGKMSPLYFGKTMNELNIYERFHMTYGLFNKNENDAVRRFVVESSYRNVLKKIYNSSFLDQYKKEKKKYPLINYNNINQDGNENKTIYGKIIDRRVEIDKIITKNLNEKFYCIRKFKPKNPDFLDDDINYEELYYKTMVEFKEKNIDASLYIKKALMNQKRSYLKILLTTKYRKRYQRLSDELFDNELIVTEKLEKEYYNSNRQEENDMMRRICCGILCDQSFIPGRTYYESGLYKFNQYRAYGRF